MKHPLLIKRAYTLLLTSLFMAPVAFASNDDDHDDHRQHSAHNHGHSTLNIVQEGNNIELMLESPAINIVGFEHAPENKKEKQLVDTALETLKKGEQLFIFSPNAQCTQTGIEIESELAKHSGHEYEHEESEHKADEDEHEGHSDFVIHYQFNCDEPSSLKTLELQFFKLFPLTKEIDAQIVTDKRQFAAELSAEQSSVNF